MNGPNLSGEIVIDASVLVKFFLDEDQDADAATTLLETFRRMTVDFAIPEFALIECVNTFWRRAREGSLSAVEAERTTRELQRFSADLVVAPIVSILPDMIRRSSHIDHPVYDMVFLALAEARGVPFITADRTLFRKIQQHKLRKPRVYLLADLELG